MIRGNVITGNPPVQVSADNPSGSGLDIKNLAPVGANSFEGNICETSVNAACSSIGPSLTASPNPVPVTSNSIVGVTTLSWNAPGAQVIEIHVGSPDGPLLTRSGNRGSLATGPWVTDGTTFYLQDVTGGNALTSDYTLATLVVHLQAAGVARFHLPGGPRQWAPGPVLLLALGACGIVFLRAGSGRKGVRIVLAGAVVLAGSWSGGRYTTALAQSGRTSPSPAAPQASAASTAETLDRMIAAGKSSRDIAQYLFDTQGCQGCHTIGREGKLGFTKKGEERAQGFEGCISTLHAMSVIAKVPEGQRSPTQLRRVQRFEEFGCATCHRLTPVNVGLTEIGTKVANLHLGCVEVEKLVAGRAASRR